MAVLTYALQTKLKDLLVHPTEVKAFELLLFIHECREHIPRGGLENKALASIPHDFKSDAIQKACMILRYTVVGNEAYEQACLDLSAIEIALHKEAKRRRHLESFQEAFFDLAD